MSFKNLPFDQILFCPPFRQAPQCFLTLLSQLSTTSPFLWGLWRTWQQSEVLPLLVGNIASIYGGSIIKMFKGQQDEAADKWTELPARCPCGARE